MWQPATQELQLFGGRKTSDGLSAVLAVNTCFNALPPTRGGEGASWPCLDWRLRSERDVAEFHKPAATIPLDWLCAVNPGLAAFVREIEEDDGVPAGSC